MRLTYLIVFIGLFFLSDAFAQSERDSILIRNEPVYQVEPSDSVEPLEEDDENDSDGFMDELDIGEMYGYDEEDYGFHPDDEFGYEAHGRFGYDADDLSGLED